MGIFNRLETELLIQLQNRATRKEMERSTYMFLMTHCGDKFVDVAEVHDVSKEYVADFIKRHRWQWFGNWLSRKLGL